MKRIIILFLACLAVVCATATDRFYIEDFSILPGETRTVSILLDNETAYTAFQTDIYLSEGLTVMKEDGDYIFDLTDRKARDHNIASQLQPDGSIRLMSYSPGIRAYNGNTGALVTFNVTASGDFSGPVSILLKNTLFTTTTGTEIAFADELCNVMIRPDRFEVDGLFYHIISNNTVEVTFGDLDYCYNGDIVIPNSVNYDGVEYIVKAIGDSAFYRSRIEEVIIPESVESIGNYAFKKCMNLAKVTCFSSIPPSLGEQCFEDYAVDLNVIYDDEEQKSNHLSNRSEYLEDPLSIEYYDEEEDEYDYLPRAMLYVPREQYGNYIDSDWNSFFMFIIIIGNGRTAEPIIEVSEQYFAGFQISVSYSIVGEGNIYYCPMESKMAEHYYGWHYYDGGTVGCQNYTGYVSEYGSYLYAFAIAPGKEPSNIVCADGGWINLVNIMESEATFNSYQLESNGICYYFNYEDEPDDKSIIHDYSTDDETESEFDPAMWSDLYEYLNDHYADDFFCYLDNEHISDDATLSVTHEANYYLTVEYCSYENYSEEGDGYDYLIDNISGYVDYFYYKGNITIPDSVEYNDLFHSVTSISDYAFIDCDQLTSITIPKSVSYIGSDAFGGCSSLSSITCLAMTPPEIYSSTFAEHYNTATLYVPSSALNAYKSAYYWKEFIHIVGIGETRIGDVDGDGNVTIADVTALIDYLLSGNAATINIGNADCDKDGSVSISDVTVLIDYLLSGNWPGEKNFTVNGVTFKMIEIAGGTFSMGATPEQGENANDNEKPVHQVTLSGYSIGQTEVTQELWQAVMGSNPSKFNDDMKKPVEKVTWNDCQTFISTLNSMTGQHFRLPTEAEWEFAARGGVMGQGYKYAGSNELDDIAWYNYNAYAVGSSSPDYGTHPVSTKAPNELGLYDMTGNVWEWCQDWFGNYSDEAQVNPVGPASGTTRIIRGGGWTNYPSLLRIAARSSYNTTFNGNFVGLRLAL